MKNIIKSIYRPLLKKPIQLIILSVLLIICGFTYSFIYNSITPLEEENTSLVEDTNREEFRLSLIEDSQEQINKLKSEYNFTAEKKEVKFLAEKEKKYYISYETKEINLPVLIGGALPKESGEVCISYNYAKGNNIDIGNIIELQGNNYKISGLYIAGDQMTIYDISKSSDIDPINNCGLLLVKEDFDKIESECEIYYIGKFNENLNLYDIRNKVKDIAKDSRILDVIVSADLAGINILDNVIMSNRSLMNLAMVLVISIISILLYFIISNNFNKSKKQISLLVAMGYSKGKIALGYLIYSLAMTPVLVIGYLLGYKFSSGFLADLLQMYNIKCDVLTLNLANMLGFILVVIAIISTIIFTMAIYYLRADVKNLINNGQSERINILEKLVKKLTKNLSIFTKVKLSVMCRRVNRLVVIFLIFILSYILICSSIAMGKSTKNLSDQLEDSYAFDKIIYIKNMKEGGEGYNNSFLESTAKILKINDEDINISTILRGVDEENDVYNDSENGKNVINDTKDGVVLSKKYQKKYNAKPGDIIVIQIGNKEGSFKVSSINDVALDDTVYIDKQELYENFDVFKSGNYNGVYLKEHESLLYSYNIEDIEINKEIKKDDVIKTSLSLNNSTKGITTILLVISILITSSMVILISRFNYEDNKYTIKLMEYMGYKKYVAHNMFLNVYDIVILISGLVGIILMPSVLKMLEDILAANMELSVEFYASNVVYIMVFAVIFIIYQLLKLINFAKDDKLMRV